MTGSDAIRCTGRRVGTDLQPYGPDCGKEYLRHRNETEAKRVRAARSAGWRIGTLPDGGITATCPTCSKPDPATLAAVREIEKGTAPK